MKNEKGNASTSYGSDEYPRVQTWPVVECGVWQIQKQKSYTCPSQGGNGDTALGLTTCSQLAITVGFKNPHGDPPGGENFLKICGF